MQTHHPTQCSFYQQEGEKCWFPNAILSQRLKWNPYQWSYSYYYI